MAATDWERRVAARSGEAAAPRSVDRGRALIEAAGAVLGRAGGGEITVQEVAAEAGQSLRTLYQHFESKDDLLLAVFEEAMRSYAQMIEAAVGGLDDPLERLGGAILAAVHLPGSMGDSGVARGLVRLRLKLAESQPELLARSQTSVAVLVRDLVGAAMAAGVVGVDDAEEAAFVLLSLNATFITAHTTGNDAGVPRPDVATFASFCLRGMGAAVDAAWIERVEAALRLPQLI